MFCQIAEYRRRRWRRRLWSALESQNRSYETTGTMSANLRSNLTLVSIIHCRRPLTTRHTWTCAQPFDHSLVINCFICFLPVVAGAVVGVARNGMTAYYYGQPVRGY
ncbi:conserved hypothetical protein [Trichinella spiralis]|uniref:hypothetical protein n=1 Tax=Trichinella spiralis TaxID=6334 RepID=UPI0001EFD4CE|nr:conserved hypothetical protein [Trichinella spiralis]